MTVDSANELRVGRTAIALAWAVLLLVSLLPRVFLHEILGFEVPSATFSIVSAALLALALAVSVVWRPLRPLVPFVILLLVLVAAEWLAFTVVDQMPAYREWLTDPSFAVYMPAEQSLRLMVTAIMIGALLVLRGRPSRFFLVPGELAAPMRRIRWLGVNEGTRWSRFGPLAAVAISGGTLVFLLIAGAPPVDLVVQAAPFLPIVLLCAALNAFNEEVTYKASFLSVLEGPVGRGHALFMVAAYFGIGHYYGVPYGLVGVVMAFALGWLLGRSMLETRGLFWAWFVHFWQDVLIFAFLAIGSIRPGG
ncbi:CPBP family intramembrane glutamic endopeptidase [Microcella sp.]|uniref:CPBP family intramembrane glutamic endopeptidase n=1 Tax=Microcella sp. TaxID=1913979 RepID=UPI0025691BBC|nr:CPBP family intramembrane glutamic endopeptidase [Microcella sp.]MBX9471269.1 CPBP family intramembrane metalloprotease [Microcella sp.]